MELSVSRSLKIIFDDRSPYNLANAPGEFEELSDVAIRKLFFSPTTYVSKVFQYLQVQLKVGKKGWGIKLILNPVSFGQ